MALILHLTDIHLGSSSDGQDLGDHKLAALSKAERTSRTKVFHDTLAELSVHFDSKKQTLDAVVISGDVTTRDSAEGYEELEALLERLGKHRPPTARILVVPGNHDVTWGTGHSTPERYKNFITYIRNKGYITPWLDGVDAVNADLSQNMVELDDGRIQLIALNSSNYCGTKIIEDISNALESQLNTTAEGVALLGQIKALKIMDIARFNPRQLSEWARFLNTKAHTCNSVRVAVLHHHLGPVDLVEEFKPFESITNLENLRRFLAAQSFEVVLHGHKHQAKAYWDHVFNDNIDADDPGHRMLVLAGATVENTGKGQFKEACRLIEIKGEPAPECSVRSVDAVNAGVKLWISKATRFLLWTTDREAIGKAPKSIWGHDLNQAYDRVLSLFEDFGDNNNVSNVVVTIETTEEPASLPTRYKADIADDVRDAWFQSVIDWWLRKSTKLDDDLVTHGQRLYAFNGVLDQIAQVVEGLTSSIDTSRAVAVLIDATKDKTNGPDHKAPHFCLVQFRSRTEAKGENYLDCIAYFRKQEMRYWWPVNVGELIKMQAHALSRLANEHPSLRLGRITTFAAIAYAGRALPRVAVPYIDRLYDEDESSIARLALAIANPQAAAAPALLDTLAEVLTDLIPKPVADVNGTPVAGAGLHELVVRLEVLAEFEKTSRSLQILERLRRLYQANKDYKPNSRDGVNPAMHKKWALACKGLVEEIEQLLKATAEPS